MPRIRLSTPRYNLKDSKSKTPTLIFLIYRRTYNGVKEKIKFSTGKHVLPKWWIQERQEVNFTSNILLDHERDDNKKLNSDLRSLKNEFSKIISEQPHLTKDKICELLNIYLGRVETSLPAIPTLPTYIGQYRDRCTKSFRTKQKYLTVKTRLEEYSIKNNIILTFDAIDTKFADNYFKYLSDDLNLSLNTVNKEFSTIKMIMREAANETIVIDGKIQPYHTNKQYERKAFNRQRIKTSKHYLTVSEVKKLASYTPTNETDIIVRDYFIAMCWTGLRVSDIFELSKNNFIKDIDGDEFIELYTYKGRDTKSNNLVMIPVLPEMKTLMEKYDYQLPRPLTTKTHNDRIKVIAEDAGIDRTINHKDGKKDSKVSSMPIYDILSNHKGRYTFINNMINHYGVSCEEMLKVTGQSMKTLLGYYDPNAIKNAKRVLQKVAPQMQDIKNIAG